ncbi:YidC/Oxa1 family membrane protein insertase [Candidatus Saccharibacteria bacterium]|nr:YidC/Oxa1 family membrane protein insertase [Candidatus Saccharibacteria bacterium]
MGWFDLLIVQPIFNLLLGIYSIARDFGLTIIIFTIIVKFLMWPLIKKQLHQAKVMRKIQPELAEIRKRTKGNKQAESLQMMDLYKRYNVKPFASILTLVIQLPIFITLYRVITMVMGDSNAIDKYAYGFMKKMPLIDQLIHQHSAFHPNLWFIDLTQKATNSPVTVSSVIILLLVLVSVLLQYKITRQQMPTSNQPKKRFRDILKQSSDGKDVDQSEINSAVSGQMTKILPIIMFVTLINFFGALALYYLVTNIITYIQQWFIFRKDEEEMETIADKKLKRDAKKDVSKIKEAKIVKDKTNITRITASDSKKRRKK